MNDNGERSIFNTTPRDPSSYEEGNYNSLIVFIALIEVVEKKEVLQIFLNGEKINTN